MRAVAFDPSSEGFRLAELPVPDPGPGDVLLRVDCCGLNPVDAKIALWRFLAPDMDADWVPGLDVAGEVVTVGPGVSGWRPGDRVLTHGNMFRPQGGFAEYTVQAAATLVPHPDVPSEVAAATPCAGWTAWRALNDKLRAQAGQSILIAGGAGGVGSFAVQIARERRGRPACRLGGVQDP